MIRRPTASADLLRLGAASLLAGLALSVLPGAGTPPDPPPPQASRPARADSLAGAPIESILKDYRVLARYELLPSNPEATRADYSGITVRNERPSLNLWLVDDKARTMATALSTLYLKLPGRPDTLIQTVRPSPLGVNDTRGVPLGDDIEDLAWVYGVDGRVWSSLVAVGEQGPNGAPHSWIYRFDLTREGLVLKSAGPAPAPPGEEVGNDGLEGVAARRMPDGRIEVLALKERGARTYTMIDTLDSNADRIIMPEAAPPRRPDQHRPRFTDIEGMSVQSGAAMRPGAREMFAIDRMKRRIAIVPLPSVGPAGVAGASAAARGPLRARLWLDYTAVDSLLEGRAGETPPSLFGTCEGITEDSQGRLYLLSDNNEANTSRLVVLAPRPVER